jgi:hypothetical protein
VDNDYLQDDVSHSYEVDNDICVILSTMLRLLRFFIRLSLEGCTCTVQHDTIFHNAFIADSEKSESTNSFEFFGPPDAELAFSAR